MAWSIIEWIKSRYRLIQNACQTLELGYTGAILEGVKLPEYRMNGFRLASGEIRRVQIRQFRHAIVDDVTVHLESSLGSGDTNQSSNDDDKFALTGAEKEAEVKRILDSAAARDASSHLHSTKSLLMDMFLYVCSVNIYNLKIVYADVIELSVSHLEVCNNVVYLRGCSILMNSVPLLQSFVNLEIDCSRHHVANVKLPPINILAEINQIQQLIEVLTKQNNKYVPAQKAIQFFRRIPMIRTIRRNQFRLALKSHCNLFQTYKMLHLHITRYDVEETLPIALEKGNGSTIQVDESANDKYDSNNLWEAKLKYDHLNETLSIRNIAEFRYYAEYSRPLLDLKVKKDIIVIGSNKPIAVTIRKVGVIEFYWRGGINFENISFHIPYLVAAAIHKLHLQEGNLCVSKFCVNDIKNEPETSKPIIKEINAQYHAAQHELLISQHVDIVMPLTLLIRMNDFIRSHVMELNRILSRTAVSSVNKNIGQDTQLEDGENFWHKFKIKLVDAYVLVPEIASLTLKGISKQSTNCLNFQRIGMKLNSSCGISGSETDLNVEKVILCVKDDIHFLCDSINGVWDPVMFVEVKDQIRKCYESCKSSQATKHMVSIAKDSIEAKQKAILLEITKELCIRLKKPILGKSSSIFKISSFGKTTISPEASQFQLNCSQSMTLYHFETSFYRELIRVSGNFQLDYIFATNAKSNSYLLVDGDGLRIIYFHQLIQEIIDYFYEGILGTKITSSCIPTHMSDCESYNVDPPKCTEMLINFKSTELILPVSYTSQQNLSIIAEGGISLKNFFTKESLRIKPKASTSFEMTVLYNNAHLSLFDVVIFNEQSRRLPVINIVMKWYMGGDAIFWYNQISSSTNIPMPKTPPAESNLLLEINRTLSPKWAIELNANKISNGVAEDSEIEVYLPRHTWHALKGFLDYNIGEDLRYTPDSIWSILNEGHDFTFKTGIKSVFKYGDPSVFPTTYNVIVTTPKLQLKLDNGGCVEIRQKLIGILNLFFPQHLDLYRNDEAIVEGDLRFISKSNNFDLVYEKFLELSNACVKVRYSDDEHAEDGILSTTATDSLNSSSNDLNHFSMREILNHLNEDFLDYFTSETTIDILDINEILNDWIQVEDLHWYNSNSHDNRSYGGSTRSDSIINKLSMLRPSNLRWQFSVKMPDFVICSNLHQHHPEYFDECPKLHLMDKSLSPALYHNSAHKSSLVGSATLVFDYLIVNDQKTKNVRVSDCSLLSSNLLDCNIFLHEDATKIAFKSLRGNSWDSIVRLVGTNIDVPEFLSDIVLQNGLIEMYPGNGGRVEVKDIVLTGRSENLSSNAISFRLATLIAHLEINNNSFSVERLTVDFQVNNNKYSTTINDAKLVQKSKNWVFKCDLAQLQDFIKIKDTYLEVNINDSWYDVQCVVNISSFEARILPLLSFLFDFNLDFSRRDITGEVNSNRKEDKRKGSSNSFVLKVKTTDIVLPAFKPKSRDPKLTYQNLEFSQLFHSYLFTSSLFNVSIERDGRASNEVNIVVKFFERIETSIDLEYVGKLFDHAQSLYRVSSTDKMSIQNNMQPKITGDVSRKIFVSVNTLPIKINAGAFQLDLSELAIQSDLSRLCDTEFQFSRIAIVEVIHSSLIAEVRSVYCTKRKLDIQQVGFFYGDWHSFFLYANDFHQLCMLLIHLIYGSTSSNDTFVPLNDKKDKAQVMNTLTLSLSKIIVCPLPNVSITSSVNFIDKIAHVKNLTMSVHSPKKSSNDMRPFPVFQPINLTISFEDFIRINLLDINFAFTFDDMNNMIKILSLISDDIKLIYKDANTTKPDFHKDKINHNLETKRSIKIIIRTDRVQWTLRDISKGPMFRWAIYDFSFTFNNTDIGTSSIADEQDKDVSSDEARSGSFVVKAAMIPLFLYYNTRNASFEPLIEKSKLRLEIEQSSIYERNIQVFCGDSSPKTSGEYSAIRINLSDAAIEALGRIFETSKSNILSSREKSKTDWNSILSTLKLQSANIQQSEIDDTQQRARLIIKNFTQLSIKYRCSTRRESNKSSTIVDASSTLPILPEDDVAITPTFTASSQHQATRSTDFYNHDGLVPAIESETFINSSKRLAVKFDGADEIRGIQCDKVGKVIRRIKVKPFNPRTATNKKSITVPLQYIVERIPKRVITFQSTVSIGCLGYGKIECGIRVGQDPSVDIEFVGVVPMSIPLRYLLLGKSIEVFVRPSNDYRWSNQYVLRYVSPSEKDFNWQQTYHMITCESNSSQMNPVLLFIKADISEEIVDLKICPVMTIRNLLPVPIKWQVSKSYPKNTVKGDVELRNNTHYNLQSGQCSDVVESSITDVSGDGQCGWLLLGISGFYCKEWIELKFLKRKNKNNDEDGTVSVDSSFKIIPSFIMNTIVTSITLENGSHCSLGVKIIPKHNFASNEVDTNNSFSCFSMEVIVYSDVWIKDLTNLGLVIGSPSPVEVKKPNLPFGSDAEATIMELTNVLEGKILNDSRDVSCTRILPNQKATHVYEEVFEYIEVSFNRNSSSYSIKRRWYATEQHDFIGMPPTSFILPKEEDGSTWIWDGSWEIDLHGVNLSEGGWESSSSIYDWNPKRYFSPREIFRRRRWKRCRSRVKHSLSKTSQLQVTFHHGYVSQNQECNLVALKIGDGAWSQNFCWSDNGIVRVLGMRWPSLGPNKSNDNQNRGESAIFDLCYVNSPIGGVWGDHTNVLSITPRILIRNDSFAYSVQVKQIGSTNEDEWLILKPGERAPFFWTSLRNPEQICIRPIVSNCTQVGRTSNYNWSGGFDPCNLGITALRVRHEDILSSKHLIRTIRANVSIRPRSYNTGINISLREEQADGTGALFRVENKTPFPIWIAQEGLMANPASLQSFNPSSDSTSDLLKRINAEMAGDCIMADQSVSFGLDDPSRQVKHGRGSAFLRAALAPLRTRDGLETTKLIKLDVGGDSIRFNPSKLSSFLDDTTCEELLDIRIVGMVVADGPSRVVRFALAQKDISASQAFSNAAKRQAKRSESYFESIGINVSGNDLMNSDNPEENIKIKALVKRGAEEALKAKASKKIPDKSRVISEISESTGIFSPILSTSIGQVDINYSVRVSLPELTFCLIDQEPSEIVVLTFVSVDLLSKWNRSRTNDAISTLSIGWLQIDNHCPNAPFAVTLIPDRINGFNNMDDPAKSANITNEFPALAINLHVAPKHISGTTCFKSITIAPSNFAIGIDLALLVRLQRYFLGALDRIEQVEEEQDGHGSDITWVYADSQNVWPLPNMQKLFDARQTGYKESLEIYFERLTVFPFSLSFSVAPSRALTSAQAALEGPGAAAIHTAVRKGDLLLSSHSGTGVLGVKIGRTNRTALAVVRGIFKSIIVDALLRCEEASLAFPGIGIRNYLSNTPQVTTYLMAQYLAALRSNVPSLIGSLAAFGNPLGLIRGLGDGVSDFVTEPIRGLQKSLEELDPTFVIDGVARGTGSLARRTIGGVADSASLLTQTLSKNMAVLSLDRKYAQRRDRAILNQSFVGATPTLMDGIGSGSAKLLKGVYDGVSGVVRAPIRGAEKYGAEGFAKGVGKGLLGLVVKPVVGLSDAATDIMIGVKGSVEGGTYNDIGKRAETIKRASHLRPRRVFYGKDRIMKEYNVQDSTAAQLMMNSQLAGEPFLSYVDMGNSGIMLLSIRRLLVIGSDPDNIFGNETLTCIKYRHIAHIEARRIPAPDKTPQWGVVFTLKTPRSDGSEVEVVTCEDQHVADEIYTKVRQASSEKHLTIRHSKNYI